MMYRCAVSSLSRFAALALISLATGSHAQNTPANPADDDITGKVMTISGPIKPEKLGMTLMREHIFINLVTPDETEKFINLTNPTESNMRWKAAGRTRPIGATGIALYEAPLTMEIIGAVSLGAPNRDNWQLSDETLALREVREFARLGGGTIVDLTTADIGRSAEKLQRVARASGLNIVASTGWYGAAWQSADHANRSVENLTDELVRDIKIGMEGSKLRAGIIGVGVENNPLSDLDIKKLKAAARASRMTGAAISLHSDAAQRSQEKILDVLAAEGADLSRVILGHTDLLVKDLAFLQQLLKRGVALQFNHLGRQPTITSTWPSGQDTLKAVYELIKAGFTNKLLVSQDVQNKIDLLAYGGTGYSFIPELFVPALATLGATDVQIKTILVENPKRLLTFATSKN